MKAVLILACLVFFVACTQGQRRCRGSVSSSRQNCVGGRNSGHSGRRRWCWRNANGRMWYYSQRTRSCRQMRYRGCGGNRNRYCTLADCQNKCIRETTTTPTTVSTPTVDPTPSPTPSSSAAPESSSAAAPAAPEASPATAAPEAAPSAAAPEAAPTTAAPPVSAAGGVASASRSPS